MFIMLCDFWQRWRFNWTYVSYHKIDPNNRFVQKLFQSNKNCSIFRKCLRCDDFLITSDYKKKHDFLKHYNEGEYDLFEDKPIDIEKTVNLLQLEITVNNMVNIMILRTLRKLLMIF